MSDILSRQPGETVRDFTERMIELVDLIGGIVQSEAGIMLDADEVIASARWIVAHASDEDRESCWQLQLEIDRVVSRMTSPTRLARVLFFAQEMAR
jgi:hypothetical protein